MATTTEERGSTRREARTTSHCFSHNCFTENVANYEMKKLSPFHRFLTTQVEGVQHHKHLYHLSEHRLKVEEVEQNLEEREFES